MIGNVPEITVGALSVYPSHIMRVMVNNVRKPDPNSRESQA